jgi:16S rRNA (cytidine1402-2'-O)-methyltransferase
LGLTFVPTPLGNLRDITLRALDVLRACDVVVAEDTRVARRLLSAHGIRGKRLVSYREQNAADATPAILESAATGSVALVTDAGMPGISDPGRELIAAARQKGIGVEVLPGPVAFVCAAVLSGFELNGLVFAGFLPRVAGARHAALRAAVAHEGPTAWYESPNRLVATLEELERIAPDARVFVARELTKAFEQQILGTPGEALAALSRPVRGEVVLVVEPPPSPPAVSSLEEVDAQTDDAIDALLGLGMSAAQAAKALAAHGAGGRDAVYKRVVRRKRARGDGAR